MLGVAVASIAFFTYVSTRLTSPSMSLLFSELAIDDSGQIITRLEGMNIPFELRGDGTQIFVPAGDVLRLRMTLAGEGLPHGGSVGYEIFDQSSAFGTTRLGEDIKRLRALEGELARSIASLAPVRAVRVHLVMSRREPFSRERDEPSASIILQLRGGSLRSSQVVAIQHLVASAVQRLQPGRVSVVDSSGTLLSSEEGGFDGAASVRNAELMRAQFEDRLAHEIIAILERTVGNDKVTAEVTAEIDFDRITTQSERYDPDGQVVRSTALEEEEQLAREAGGADAVSVANNIPNAPDQLNAGVENSNRSTITRETTNFEISRVMETHVREGGLVKHLSVAVLVDGTYDENGTYLPRGEADLQKFAQLVRSAIGYREERGDVVEVVNLQFATVEDVLEDFEEAGMFDFGTNDIIRIAEMLVLGLVSILVLLLVVRPLVSRLVNAAPLPPVGPGGNLLTNQAAGTVASQLAPPSGAPTDDDESEMLAKMGPSKLEKMMDMSQVEGRVRDTSMKRITEMVENHPEETVSIVRTWMVENR